MGVAVKTTVTLRGINYKKLSEKIKTKIDDIAYDVGEYCLNVMRSFAPVRTGKLRWSLEMLKKTKRTATIGTNISYAGCVIHGTRPHFIHPVNAKALRWESPNGPVFAKYVFHPGTRPNDFMGRAMDYSEDQVKFMIKKKTEEAQRMSNEETPVTVS